MACGRGMTVLLVSLGLCLPTSCWSLREPEPGPGREEGALRSRSALVGHRSSASVGDVSWGMEEPHGSDGGLSITGRRCVEPTGESDPTHPSHIRDNFYNQYGCKIPLREGKSNFGYQHIVKRGLEKLQQGNPDNHEVTPYARWLWAAALGRPGGSLLLNTTGYFVASQQYEIRGGAARTMCVFYATYDLSYANQTYEVMGIITAFWIPSHSDNPSQSCRDARE